MRHKGLFVLALFAIMPVTVFADSLITKEAIVVETFDGEGATNHLDTSDPVIWQAKGSKFKAEGFPKSAYANAFPEELFGKNPENEADLYSYAVMGSYVRRGFNWLEIVPGVGTGEDWVARPLKLPGRVEYFDFWVWGSNFNYTVEVHLKDYRGIIHVLDLGSIKHIGWKHMYVKIPSYIRQSGQYLPFFKGLSLTKIVVRTDPEEIVNKFYVYFDQLKVLTDMHIFNFDGEDLTDPKKLEEIWGGDADE